MKRPLKCLIVALTILCFSLPGSNRAFARDSIQLAGDVMAVVLPVAAGGMILGHKDGDGAIQLAESAALALSTTFLLKYTVNETRPNGEDRHSFPSAHTSGAFTAAEFLRKRYGWVYGVPAYAAASFVAYSRVESRQHYATDVLVGAAIGIGSSFLFTRPFEGWTVRADADPGYYGLRVSSTW